MVERRLRGKLILPALARPAYRYTAERTALLVFTYCAPGRDIDTSSVRQS
jgi:hypothetical protein